MLIFEIGNMCKMLRYRGYPRSKLLLGISNPSLESNPVKRLAQSQPVRDGLFHLAQIHSSPAGLTVQGLLFVDALPLAL